MSHQQRPRRVRIATNIRERREELGLSQEALARIIGVRSLTISRWERGVSAPEDDNLASLREVGVDIPPPEEIQPVTLTDRVAMLEQKLEELRAHLAPADAHEETEDIEAARRGDPPTSPRMNPSGRRDAQS